MKRMLSRALERFADFHYEWIDLPICSRLPKWMKPILGLAIDWLYMAPMRWSYLLEGEDRGREKT